MNTQQSSYASNRERYLMETLNLNHDPFAFFAVEQELQQPDLSDDPPFFSYFVHPPYQVDAQTPDEPLLDLLKRPTHAFVYGDGGCGKTMLRYMLEAACRAVPDRTLVSSYTIGKGNQDAGQRSLETALAQSLATDLFVQFVEQFHRYDRVLDESKLETLANYWHSAIPNFGRTLRRHLAQGQPDGVTGISIWWKTWKRVVVRRIPLTAQLQTFLHHILEGGPDTSRIETNVCVRDGLQLAQDLGYKQVFFLFDVVGENGEESPNATAQLDQLLRFFSSISSPLPLYLKHFLPEQLKPFIQNYFQETNTPLTGKSISAIMKWNQPDALLQIIENRFRSAGSWIEGFDAIASQDVADQINHLLVRSAHASPRRLIQVVSSLVDAHAQSPENATITSADWQAMCRTWSYGSPAPASLPPVTSKRDPE